MFTRCNEKQATSMSQMHTTDYTALARNTNFSTKHFKLSQDYIDLGGMK